MTADFFLQNCVHVFVYLSSFGISYGYELLSDDRQHFNVDSVKFVKTTPGSWLCQPTEEPTHHLYKNIVIH